MTLWIAIALASATAFLNPSYAVPVRWLNNPLMARVAGAITVALLVGLDGDEYLCSRDRAGARRAAAVFASGVGTLVAAVGQERPSSLNAELAW